MGIVSIEEITTEVYSELLASKNSNTQIKKRRPTYLSQIAQECKIRSIGKLKIIDIINNKPEAARIRGILAGACGSIWAFTIASFRFEKQTIGRLPNHIIEHAIIINNTFDSYLDLLDDEIKREFVKLRTPNTYKLLKQWTSDTRLRTGESQESESERVIHILKARVEEFIQITSPIYKHEKLYSTIDIKHFMELDELYRQRAENDFVEELIQITREEYSIDFGSNRFVYGLELLGLFPKSYDLLEIYNLRPYNTWVINEIKRRYIKKQLERILKEIEYQKTELGSTQFEYLISLVLGFGDKEGSLIQGITYNNIGYLLSKLYIWVNKQYNSNSDLENIHWKPIQTIELPISHKIVLSGLKLDDICYLKSDFIAGRMIEAGCETVLDIIKYLYEGKLQCDKTRTLDYKNIRYFLTGVDLEEFLRVRHSNTPEELKTLGKRELIGKGEDWLLSKATVKELLGSEFESSTKLDELGLGWSQSATTSMEQLIAYYNNGELYSGDIETILEFKNKMNSLGFGYLLTYNYILEFLNTSRSETEKKYLRELMNKQGEKLWPL